MITALSRTLSKLIATVFYIGYIPFAPGTFGSLAGMVFVWLSKPGFLVQAVLVAAGLAAGAVSAHRAEKELGEKDSRRIVIDEFVGYLVAVLALPLTAGYLVAAFVLFRFFDIVKPPPIRNIDKAVGGGLGVMLDDVVAGMAANVLLQIWRLAANGTAAG